MSDSIYKVLVVDDDRITTQYYVDALMESGFEIVVANSVERFLEYRSSISQFAVIVMDVMMDPGKVFSFAESSDGMETGILLLRMLADFDYRGCVVALTNTRRPSAVKKIHALKVAYINKQDLPPFDFADQIIKVCENRE